jgi:hypothetical protein
LRIAGELLQEDRGKLAEVLKELELEMQVRVASQVLSLLHIWFVVWPSGCSSAQAADQSS